MTEPELFCGKVYLIHATGTTLYKIGHTYGPVENRLKDLQVGNPFRLNIVAIRGGSRRDESRLHCEFFPQSVRGEWFNLPDIEAAKEQFLSGHSDLNKCREYEDGFTEEQHKIARSLCYRVIAMARGEQMDSVKRQFKGETIGTFWLLIAKRFCETGKMPSDRSIINVLMNEPSFANADLPRQEN